MTSPIDGTPRYWSHMAHDGSARPGLRWAADAFRLMPIVTREAPLADVLLIDLSTHPRLMTSAEIIGLTKDGVHLTNAAMLSLPMLDHDHVQRTVAANGETLWTVVDTGRAFADHIALNRRGEDDPTDVERNQERIRRMVRNLPSIDVRSMPIDGEALGALEIARIEELSELVALDPEDMAIRCGMPVGRIGDMQRSILATLSADAARRPVGDRSRGPVVA